MKKNILIVVDNLVVGGVTKVLANMLNLLDYSKYDIDLLVLHNHENMAVTFPKDVKIIDGSPFFSVIDQPIKKLLAQKKFFKVLHKIILASCIKTNIIKQIIKNDRKKALHKNYDLEIGFCDGFSHLYTCYGNTPYKVVWLHSDIKVMNYSQRYISIIKKALQNVDMAVGVSDKVRESYEDIYQLKNCITIPNLINTDEILNKSLETLPIKYNKNLINIISVGRLDFSKNYEMLISVHKKLIDDGYNICTYIVGDGTEKSKLEQLIKELNISNSFILLGQKSNPYPYVKNADLFALTSRYEGLPTVILEALTLHVPCISTEVAGVASVLKSDYGLIANNSEDDFYEKLKYLLDNPSKLQYFRENLSTYKYDNDAILKKITMLFDGGKNE